MINLELKTNCFATNMFSILLPGVITNIDAYSKDKDKDFIFQYILS